MSASRRVRRRPTGSERVSSAIPSSVVNASERADALGVFPVLARYDFASDERNVELLPRNMIAIAGPSLWTANASPSSVRPSRYCSLARSTNASACERLSGFASFEVVGSAALVGSSNFTHPGITENIELNVQITGAPVTVLQEWYEEHWNDADDVTPEILRVVERHVREYSPFEVYAKSLYELFADATPGEQIWEETQSRMFHVLDGYQQDGYRNLFRISQKHGGALLCDGVGLGKTFVGLMLIERLIVREKLNVLLLAPKGALESVWQPALQKYLRKLSGRPSNLVTAAHTDLGLEKYHDDLDNFRERIHAIVIDEAHHFRNPGAAGTGVSFLEAPKKAQEPLLFRTAKRSRYRELFDIIPSPDGTRKKLYLLTATPINNSFHDLRHVIELFTQQDESHFGQTLGVQSLTAHFKRMEKKLDPDASATVIDDAAARAIMARDPLVGALVVQRSRAFVKEKQRAAGAPITAFPPRQPPHRVPYSLKKVYGRLLDSIESAFHKDKPLFTLPMYYPLAPTCSLKASIFRTPRD